MTMDEFTKMVCDVRTAEHNKKGPDYELTEGEKSQLIFRRSIFSVKDIAEGEEFTEDNIRIIRPGYGASPKMFSTLIGKKSKQGYKHREPIKGIYWNSLAYGVLEINI